MMKIEKQFKKPDNVLWFVRSTMRNMCSLREKIRAGVSQNSGVKRGK